MQIVRSLSEFEAEFYPSPSVATIGNFDGVHCGHRMVIAYVLERSRILSTHSVAVTFEPHPAHVLYPQLSRQSPRLSLITPLAQKLDLLAATGLDVALVLPFDDELRHWSAREFAERVLHNALHAIEVHEGETFRFGHEAKADIAGLSQLGREFGFTVRAYQPCIGRGAAISSSRIRSLVASGKLAEARALLGRSFSIRSTPAPGRGYGSRYTVPTINLAPYAELLPAHGVYVSTLQIGSAEDAPLFRGVTNIGNRPTFGADSFAIETHLLDFEPIPLTESTPLELTFLHRLRPEGRFDSPEALRAQIRLDITSAERYFALADALGAPLP
jgi:riboflavin kinase/FMN adenylyltransferase